MPDRTKRNALRTTIVAALAAILSWSTNAAAEPVALFAISGNGPFASLRGDLSGDILALNSTAPMSRLLVDFPSQSETLPAMPNQLVYSALGANIFLRPNVTTTVTTNDWLFDMSGSMNFANGTANLALTPVQPFRPLSATVSASPVFFGTIDSGLGPVAEALAQATLATNLALLNAVDLNLDVDVDGSFSVVPGTASAALVQNGAVIQVDVGLHEWKVVGEIDVDTTVTYDTALPSFLEPNFENILENFVTNFIAGLLTPTINDLVEGLLPTDLPNSQLQCTVERVSLSRTDTECTLSTELSYFGIGQAVSVPEPVSSGVFGTGLAALLLARRRRRV